MQEKTGRGAALAGLCLLALAACDAQPGEPAARPAETVEETPAPVAAEPSSAPMEESLDAVPAPEDEAATPGPAPARKTPGGAPVASVLEPQEPPVEVEGLVIIGPRDGETLGEYRARADRVFRRLDVDGDGRLDREEITSGAGRLSLRTALEQSDIDLNEAVSTQEFGDLTTRAFQRLDADGDGVITDTEMEAGDPLAAD